MPCYPLYYSSLRLLLPGLQRFVPVKAAAGVMSGL